MLTGNLNLLPPTVYILNFQPKVVVAHMCATNVICSRVSNLESPEFSTLWLKLSCNSTTKFICSVYLSPNSTEYNKFFDYLNSEIEDILSSSPFSEIISLGAFNVHHGQWLSSSFHDLAGELAFNFSIQNNLEQLVQLPNRIPDPLVMNPTYLIFS